MSAVAEKFPPLLVLVLATGLVLFTFVRPLFAQTTVRTGGIVGTVSDPSGAVMRGAKVAIPNLATQQVVNLPTNSSGSFNSGRPRARCSSKMDYSH